MVLNLGGCTEVAGEDEIDEYVVTMGVKVPVDLVDEMGPLWWNGLPSDTGSYKGSAWLVGSLTGKGSRSPPRRISPNGFLKIRDIN